VIDKSAKEISRSGLRIG